MKNSAAWMQNPSDDLRVRDAEMPIVSAGQLLIRVDAVAINPLDAIIQSNGKMMYGWLTYPVVLGQDVAGVVASLGPGVTDFAVGDRVVAYARGLEKGQDARGGGGFQHFVAVDATLTAILPSGMPAHDAVVLPLAFTTAAAALFEAKQLALDYSALGSGTERDEIVVVWGGASSVGGNAIQLARAAGYRVITTASPKNHARMQELGAEAVFDYRDTAAVADIVAAVGGDTVSGVLAVATGSASACLSIAKRTGARRVAMASPPVSFFDQPRRRGLSLARIRIVARLVGRSTALQVRSRVNGIRASFVWGSAIADSAVGGAVWGEFLPGALASGAFAVYPPARTVGRGLGDVQAAIDEVRRGVSAQKLVVVMDRADAR